MRRRRAVTCGPGPGPAHSQIASSASDANRDQLLDSRGFENMSPSRGPESSTHHYLSLLHSPLCFSLRHTGNSMWPPAMTPPYLRYSPDTVSESMHHNVCCITYPQLVSSRLSPTWREAMPKSAILMLFFSSSNRFSGFRSLWLRDEKNIKQLMKHERAHQKSCKLVKLKRSERCEVH